MKARIYSPSKTAMQAGQAKTGAWVLEYESPSHRRPDPLMGWTQSDDTMEQVRMKFPTLEQAEAFAESKNIKYTIVPSHKKRIKPRNYSDNFKYIPVDE